MNTEFQNDNETSNASQDSYKIEVRARPVKGWMGIFATHCFIAKIQYGEVKDSLSFDPSNSNGRKDSEPDNIRKGKVVVWSDLNYEKWELKWKILSGKFEEYGNKRKYNLATHNCCHAVIDALNNTEFSNVNYLNEGINFAKKANKMWYILWSWRYGHFLACWCSPRRDKIICDYQIGGMDVESDP